MILSEKHDQREQFVRMVGLETQLGDIASENIKLRQELDIVKKTLGAPQEHAHQAAAHQTQIGATMAPNLQAGAVPQVQVPRPAPMFQEPGTGITATAQMPMPVPPTLEVPVAANQPTTYDVTSGTPVPATGPFGTAQLITTAESSAPIPGGALEDSVGPYLGPFAPGLEPIRTMVAPFETVLNYRLYRLRDTSSAAKEDDLRRIVRLKLHIEGLQTSMEKFDATRPIKLLDFLATFKEAVDALGKSEAVAVRVLAFFLEGDAKDAYMAQMAPGTRSRGTPLSMTWPYVINMLLERFLSDDVLEEAHDEVTRAVQRDREDEMDFAQRILDASRVCRHVFTPTQLVNNFVRGLKEATRERVKAHVARMSASDRSSLSIVSKFAASEGRAQRAEARPMSQSSKSLPTTTRGGGPKKGGKAPTMYLGAPGISALNISPPTTPTTVTEPDDPPPGPRYLIEPHNPISIVDTAVNLESIFVMSEEYLAGAVTGMNLEGRDFMRPSEKVPDLTTEQIQQGIAAIPADYWQLSCWSCREPGHTTFTCPQLDMSARIYFAYKYYLHQVAANPALKEWYKQKMIALQGQGSHPGPRPGGLNNRRGGYGGRGYGRGGYRPQVPRPQPVPAQAAAPAAPAPPPVVQVITNDHTKSSSSSTSSEGN